MATTDVLLMAYGAAGSLDEVEPYLADIRSGRPSSPELIAEVKRRYEQMGGRSPLLSITTGQAQALETLLNGASRGNFRVWIGMRHWHPFIHETVEKMVAEGVRRMVALCLTPYYSRLSMGAYFAKLNAAREASKALFETILIESWNDHPRLLDALAQVTREALERFPAAERGSVPVLFTAHSLPERILKEQDPYPGELLETAEGVAKRIGVSNWKIAYQSQGRTPEPWLGPEAGTVIRALAAEGGRNVLLAPIGFISDHMETLYDVDILYRDLAASLGMRLERAPSLNTSPILIEAMADLVLSRLPRGG